MKKAILVILSIIAVCTLCLAETVCAAKAGYTAHIDFGANAVVIDGKWTTSDEWTDAYYDWFYSGWIKTTAFWADKWDMTPNENWLIEVLTDTTSDAGDFFQMSYDCAVDGGAAPNANDFLLNITGHTSTGVKIYAGTGTGWGTSSAVLGTDIVVNQSMASSPKSAAVHWIIEIQLMKLGTLAMGYSNNPRVAVYDKSNASAGVLMWPPYSSADVPDTYGTGSTEFGSGYPEGLTIGVMVALSSVAVIVSTRYFRKSPKL